MLTMRHFMFDLSFRPRRNRISCLLFNSFPCCRVRKRYAIRLMHSHGGPWERGGLPCLCEKRRHVCHFVWVLRLIPGPRSPPASCARIRGTPLGDCAQFYTPLPRKCQEKNHRSAQLSAFKAQRTGVTRVFPAVPADFEGGFENLGAQGAFVVGAQRDRNGPRSVTVRSLAGNPCAFANPWPGRDSRVVCVETGEEILAFRDAGMLRFDTRPGQTYTTTR